MPIRSPGVLLDVGVRMTLDVDREFEALNHGTGWPHGRPRACMIHATRSGQPNRTSVAGHRLETTSTINWFLSPESRASSNLIISSVEIVRMVSDEDYAWHAKEHSDWMYSIETTQALPTAPYLDGHYELLARAGRHYVSLGVPPVYLPHYSNGMSGFTGHEDSEQGVRDGKSDPGTEFDWDRFIAMIKEPEQENDMTTYKLFQTWNPAKLWLICYTADVPIYRRWITTQAGAQQLIAAHGEPETISEDQLASIPAL